MKVTGRSVLAFKYNLDVQLLNVAFYNPSNFFQAKVRARLSRPLQKGSRKHVSHGAYRSGHNYGRLARLSRSRPAPRGLPACMARRIGNRVPPVRPVSVRDRRPVKSMSVRARPVAHPARSSDKRPTGTDYLFF